MDSKWWRGRGHKGSKEKEVDDGDGCIRKGNGREEEAKGTGFESERDKPAQSRSASV